jgi:hypothetical protein
VTKEPKREMFGEVAADAWEHDVWLMGRRMAMLYHYLTAAVVDRLGPDDGARLIKDAVWQYGEHCGRAVRDGVLAAGLPLTADNFRTVPDLPSRGWRSRAVELPDGTVQHQAVLCPLARAWADLGTDPALARLYCFVDQSKTAGYNPDELECVHLHNVLDGDPFCEIVMRPKEADKGREG